VTFPLILLGFHKAYSIPGTQPGTKAFAITSMATLLIEYERHEFWGKGSLQIDCAREPEKGVRIKSIQSSSPHWIIVLGKGLISVLMFNFPLPYHQLLAGAFLDGKATAAGIKRINKLLRKDCKNVTLLSTVLLS
jgi:hypothetical protein